MPRDSQGPGDRIPQAGDDGRPADISLLVDLPGGGQLELLNPGEVSMWNEASKRYQSDYHLTKQNDLILLGALLSQVLMMYRAQRELVDPDKMMNALATIKLASEEIRKGEKALGIDKATREKGGAQTVADYVKRLKRAGFEKGVRISERVLEYEKVMMEARWKLRLLRNGDIEDRDYHKITEASICAWLEVELAKIEEKDKIWAKERAAVFVGKL